MTRLSPIAMLVGALLLGACGVGNRLAASRSDYALYRETRVAATPEQRLAAGSRYLREQPEGRFRSEVRAWFEVAEPRFVQEAHDRPSLLRAYLRAMPNGPHAQAVRDRLEEFELLNQYREKREARSERLISRVEAELAKAQAERERFIAAVTGIVNALANVRSFGRPTQDLDDALIYRFRLEQPAGKCIGDACVKAFVLPYSVPTRDGLIARSASLTLAIDLEAGLVKRVRFAGPELFSRLTEAFDRVLLDPKDLLARTEAIARAIQLLENGLEPSLPSSECRRDVIAPVVLSRVCRGVALSMIVATEPGELDRIEVSAAAP
ncbi:MAG: hypothetical protein ACOY0T_23925 [Myxococcota bacterium]